MPSFNLGESIPPETAHAVSVSLPTWKANIGYEEGEEWVTKSMTTGYPRFFIHKSIQAFADDIVAQLVGKPPGSGWGAFIFPTRQAAARCLDFIRDQWTSGEEEEGEEEEPRAVHLVLDAANPATHALAFLRPAVSAVACPAAALPLAKLYWQHTGDGVSSRRAEFCHALFRDGLLRPADGNDNHDGDRGDSDNSSSSSRPMGPGVGEARHDHLASSSAAAAAAVATTTTTIQASVRSCKGPKRYQRAAVAAITPTAANGRLRHPGDAPPSPPASPPAQKQRHDDAQETSRFIEERWGRNLDLSLVERAKSAIRRRVAGALRSRVSSSNSSPSSSDDRGELAGIAPAARPDEMEANPRGIAGLREEDVLLYPCGMNAIFNVHCMLLAAAAMATPDISDGSLASPPPPPPPLRSICFGFSYVDTLKVLQKFGPGCVFYPHGSEAELDELEARLAGGERFGALFCEFPANPLLTTPNLARIRRLADEHGIAVVVDETIGTLANVNVLPFADVVVSSLTKIFSGACNVMGGAAVLNPRGSRYAALRKAAAPEREKGKGGGGLGLYEDAYWAEDVVFLERNSRDFGSRIHRTNANAEALCELLLSSAATADDDAARPPLVRQVYYPRLGATRASYDACRLDGGGYGGLLSVVFGTGAQAAAFYDAVDTAKGPSLGTNFTLASPYVLLAHYQELDWVEGFGIDRNLIRISVGLEETAALVQTFRAALDVAAKAA